MAAYDYLALDRRGKQKKGVLEGDNARQVRQSLRDQGLTPLNVTAVAGGKTIGSNKKPAMARASIKTADLALFTRQLATLVQAGLPLEEALKAAAQQTPTPRLKSLMMEVRSRVVEGHTLANALAEYPKVFNDLYRATVDAGEHSGHLGLVLERLADYTETRQQTQQKLQMALIYPFILMGVAIAVITALMIFVVPELVKIFEHGKAELPPLTVAVIALSDFISNYGLYVLVGIFLLFILFKYLMGNESFKKGFHLSLLKTPLVSAVVRGMDISRFASTLSILMSSGVPMLQALSIAAQVMSNLGLRASVAEVAVRVREGSSLKVAMDSTGQFPPMMLYMVASGEASGELETMLDRVAQNQQRELQMKIDATMAAFEPLMVVFMGVVVLLIVLSIMLPIFDLNSLVN